MPYESQSVSAIDWSAAVPINCGAQGCQYVISDIYSIFPMSPNDKPLVWLHGEVKTPPLSSEARLEAGFLLRRLQRGDHLEMPHSRPMPSIGPRCHELRINDVDGTWRVVYRIDTDAIVIADVFAKKTQKTPDTVIKTCRKRLKEYDDA
jgi:phage-related protein